MGIPWDSFLLILLISLASLSVIRGSTLGTMLELGRTGSQRGEHPKKMFLRLPCGIYAMHTKKNETMRVETCWNHVQIPVTTKITRDSGDRKKNPPALRFRATAAPTASAMGIAMQLLWLLCLDPRPGTAWLTGVPIFWGASCPSCPSATRGGRNILRSWSGGSHKTGDNWVSLHLQSAPSHLKLVKVKMPKWMTSWKACSEIENQQNYISQFTVDFQVGGTKWTGAAECF